MWFVVSDKILLKGKQSEQGPANLRRFSTTSFGVGAGAARGGARGRWYHRRRLLAEQTLHLGPVQVRHRGVLMLVRHQGPDVPFADHLPIDAEPDTFLFYFIYLYFFS